MHSSHLPIVKSVAKGFKDVWSLFTKDSDSLLTRLKDFKKLESGTLVTSRELHRILHLHEITDTLNLIVKLSESSTLPAYDSLEFMALNQFHFWQFRSKLDTSFGSFDRDKPKLQQLASILALSHVAGYVLASAISNSPTADSTPEAPIDFSRFGNIKVVDGESTGFFNTGDPDPRTDGDEDDDTEPRIKRLSETITRVKSFFGSGEQIPEAFELPALIVQILIQHTAPGQNGDGIYRITRQQLIAGLEYTISNDVNVDGSPLSVTTRQQLAKIRDKVQEILAPNQAVDDSHALAPADSPRPGQSTLAAEPTRDHSPIPPVACPKPRRARRLPQKLSLPIALLATGLIVAGGAAFAHLQFALISQDLMIGLAAPAAFLAIVGAVAISLACKESYGANKMQPALTDYEDGERPRQPGVAAASARALCATGTTPSSTPARRPV